MGYFDNLKAINVFRESKPFSGLLTVKGRADQLLKGKPAGEIERTAEQIEWAIAAYVEEQIEEDVDRHAGRLRDIGGWELQYLESAEAGYSPTYSEIRDLLENWPHYATDKPDILSADEIAGFDALRDILNSDGFYSSNQTLLFSGAQLYAILALMKIEDAARLLRVEEIMTDSGIPISQGLKPWKIQNVVQAGNMIIEAMEIVCWAERQLSNDQLDESRAQERKSRTAREAAEHQQNEKAIRSANGVTMAKLRWKKDKAARESAMEVIDIYLKKWDASPDLYANQGEFSMDMEEKIGRDEDDIPVYAASTIQVKIIPRLRRQR
jgi:hypothetical protein